VQKKINITKIVFHNSSSHVNIKPHMYWQLDK